MNISKFNMRKRYKCKMQQINNVNTTVKQINMFVVLNKAKKQQKQSEVG